MRIAEFKNAVTPEQMLALVEEYNHKIVVVEEYIDKIKGKSGLLRISFENAKRFLKHRRGMIIEDIAKATDTGEVVRLASKTLPDLR